MNRISIDGGKTFYDIKTQRDEVQDLIDIADELAEWVINYDMAMKQGAQCPKIEADHKDLLNEILVQMDIDAPGFYEEQIMRPNLQQSMVDDLEMFLAYTGKDLVFDFPGAQVVQRSIARRQGTVHQLHRRAGMRARKAAGLDIQVRRLPSTRWRGTAIR